MIADDLLVRITTHANDEHQADLCRSLSARLGLRPRHIVGVRLSHLTEESVEVSWITLDGGHHVTFRFPETAATPDDVLEQLGRVLTGSRC
ncbi:hypothetical protein [Nocardioides sp. NPDC047086]|uniref:hypothetical protein n=1 Tax=Nocardioides sp. NPDC047086 TaxID=3154810 RepID=UPI0033EAD3E7